MSSVAPMCSKCGFARGEVSEEQLREFGRRKQRDRIYHLKMTSYIVISVFLAAFGWYWWESSGFVDHATFGPVMMLGLSSLAYIVVRVQLFLAKKKLKSFR